MEVLMCLGVVLICLECVGTRQPWVLGEVTAPVEKQFGPSAVHRKKPDRTADPLCGGDFALVLCDVERDEVPGAEPGAELAGDEVGETSTCIETSPNAPTAKPGTCPELHVSISASAGPTAAVGVPSFASSFRAAL